VEFGRLESKPERAECPNRELSVGSSGGAARAAGSASGEAASFEGESGEFPPPSANLPEMMPERADMTAACCKAAGSGGSPGVDNMAVHQL
jgi:hypothetical protein